MRLVATEWPFLRGPSGDARLDLLALQGHLLLSHFALHHHQIIFVQVLDYRLVSLIPRLGNSKQLTLQEKASAL